MNVSASTVSGTEGALANKLFKLKGPAINLAYGKGVSDSLASIDAGAIVSGIDVAVTSANSNDFEVSAVSSAIQAQSLARPSASHSATDSRSVASMAGNVTATGTVLVDSQAINTANKIEANAEVADETSDGTTTGKSTKNAISKGLSGITKPDGSSGSGTFGIAAAVALVDSFNQATAT